MVLRAGHALEWWTDPRPHSRIRRRPSSFHWRQLISHTRSGLLFMRRLDASRRQYHRAVRLQRRARHCRRSRQRNLVEPAWRGAGAGRTL